MFDYKSFTVALDQYIAYQNTKHRSQTQKNETLPQNSIIFHSSLQEYIAHNFCLIASQF